MISDKLMYFFSTEKKMFSHALALDMPLIRFSKSITNKKFQISRVRFIFSSIHYPLSNLNISQVYKLSFINFYIDSSFRKEKQLSTMSKISREKAGLILMDDSAHFPTHVHNSVRGSRSRREGGTGVNGN